MPAKPKSAKRGRPPLPAGREKKNDRFTVLFYPSESAMIEAAAASESKRTGTGVTVTEWIRDKVMVAAKNELLE